MADLRPRDRLDVPIWNAIEANNFKQALKLVDKRLAKKQSDYLDALKIYVRSRFPTIAEKSAVLLHIEDLASKKSVIRDIDAIDLYDEALEEVLPQKEAAWSRTIGELRWQYVKAVPKDEENVSKCFQECLANGDLDHARQISNILEKTYPSNHAYIFWNITTMYLYATSESCPEAQRKIWGGLAYGQIVKLATATQQTTDSSKLPLRAIQTPQELLLLQKITEKYGTTQQRLDFLADQQLGPDSSIAKGEWELWRIRLQLLEQEKQWQTLFDVTTSLLERARTKDAAGIILEPGMSDWIVWEAFLKSAIRLEGHKQKPIVLQELEAHLDPESGIDKTWRRNAALAWVKFCFKTATPFSVIPGPNGMGQQLNHIPIIIKYLQKWGDTTAAYTDLKPYITRLDLPERKQLLELLLKSNIFEMNAKISEQATASDGKLGAFGEDLSTAKSVAQVINVYKLRYLLVSALPEHERVQSPPASGQSSNCCVICSQSCGKYCTACLKQLAADSIVSYKAALSNDATLTKNLLSTDRHPADDLCILAAMCLYKSSMSDDEAVEELLNQEQTAYLVQAMILLEFGWSKSKSNFQFSILLSRFYCYLGCGSLAMRAYQRLSPKQIQLDTLSYLVFDRISSYHPHDVTHIPEGAPPSKPHQEQIKKQHRVYRNARGQIAKNMWLSFKHNNYNSVLEMSEAANTMSRTLAGAMSVVESRKITRLTHPETALNDLSGGYDILPNEPEQQRTTLVDTNDYSTFPNFESGDGMTFEVLSRFAPMPSAIRCQAGLAAEKLKQILSPNLPDGKRQQLLNWLTNFAISRSTNRGKDAYTLAEAMSTKAEDILILLTREVSDRSRWEDEKFKTRVQNNSHILRQALEDVLGMIDNNKHTVPAFWTTLHTLYTAYDVARTTHQFIVYANKQIKINADILKEIGEELSGTTQQLQQVVLEQVKAIKKGLDEGGWIDKLIDGALPESGSLQETGDLVRGLVDENFLEEWAGLVVESWGESVQGLNLLQPLR